MAGLDTNCPHELTRIVHSSNSRGSFSSSSIPRGSFTYCAQLSNSRGSFSSWARQAVEGPSPSSGGSAREWPVRVDATGYCPEARTGGCPQAAARGQGQTTGYSPIARAGRVGEACPNIPPPGFRGRAAGAAARPAADAADSDGSSQESFVSCLSGGQGAACT